MTAPSGKSLSSLRVTLPSGLKISKSKASLRRNVKITPTGGKAKSRVTSRTVSITPSGTGVTKLKLVVKPAGYSLTGALKRKGIKRGSKLTVRAAVGISGATPTSSSLSVKVR